MAVDIPTVRSGDKQVNKEGRILEVGFCLRRRRFNKCILADCALVLGVPPLSTPPLLTGRPSAGRIFRGQQLNGTVNPREDESQLGQLHAEFYDLIASLRALAISRKCPATLQDILLDYEEFEGHPLQVGMYGFESVEQFLESTGEFVLTAKQGETYVIPRHHESTAHIAHMVKKQKKSKRRSCKIYTTSIHLTTSRSSRKRRRKRAAREELITPQTTPDISFQDDYPSEKRFVRSVTPPPPAWTAEPQPQEDIPWEPDSSNLPNSTYLTFLQSFPEQIHSYNDVELAIALEIYCSFQGIPAPSYNVYTLPSAEGFFCAVIVEQSCFSTEPCSFPTPLQAKIECAYLALKSIHAKAMLRLWPVRRRSRKKLAGMIYEELRQHFEGVTCQVIPEMFQRAYGERLPGNWFSVVRYSPLFSIRVSASGDILVLANSF
ncbi:uncharacterized protein LOC119654171 isoform X2 [Hermetia illucens]|uniref:uncharacterized protein LOC119654171 isoform X2 n=1 Tax=Hermetia illucens TaxID=343691 RepID=UPI0018CC638F|nr:uncharacterized protein LOC119654171 isoform X2 [Hermetia illucens]